MARRRRRARAGGCARCGPGGSSRPRARRPPGGSGARGPRSGVPSKVARAGVGVHQAEQHPQRGATCRRRWGRGSRSPAPPRPRTRGRTPPARSRSACSGPGCRWRASPFTLTSTPMRLSVLDQSPISEGMTGAEALHNTLDLARLRRPARLPPLLGGRAPRHADAGQRQPRGADRPDGVRHRAHPRRQRRRDAAALQPVQGGRDVQRARRPVPRAGSTCGLGRAPGHRPAHHARPAARPPPGGARRLPPAAGRAARLPRGRDRPRTTRSRGSPRCRDCPSARSRGCSAPRRRARSGPAQLGLPLRVRRLHQPRTAPRSPRSTASGSTAGERLPAPRMAVVRVGDLRRHRRGGPAPGRQQPHEHVDAAPGPADPGAARGEGAALPGVARRAPSDAVGPGAP